MHVAGEDQGHPGSQEWGKVLKSGKGPEHGSKTALAE